MVICIVNNVYILLMKKFTFVLIGFFAAFSMTAFATSIARFTDTAYFADWYATSINKMADLGVVKGYGDGSFKPENNVTRGEMVVMLDRLETSMSKKYDDILNERVEKVLKAYDSLASYELPSYIKVLVTMADAGLRKMDAPPSNMQELTILTDYSLPEGYTLYAEENIVYTYYLHFKGDRIEGDVVMPHNDWFGPF